MEGTRYAYTATSLFPGTQHDVDSDDPDFFINHYGSVMNLLDSDDNIDAVRKFLENDPYRSKWVSDYGSARCIDILLTMAKPRTAAMLVRVFNANPGQQDASNGMSAIEYRAVGSAERSHMMRLADEFEARNHWFEQVAKK